jgi:hypothetical protein
MVVKRINTSCNLVALICFFSLFFYGITEAQTRISGQLKDTKNKPLPYASVSIENTIDGTTTDSLGHFSFKTREKGKHVLLGTCIGYETQKDTIDINKSTLIHTMIIREKPVSIREVVVTAGAFEANDDPKVAILKPLDIYTNAGSGGDIAGAIRTLPGAQAQTDQTGLFVRGGDASESSFIVDGMVVQNPFASNVPGVSQRSRFMPFQFKGISFSSGGYSVRYGQALSSVLELNTMDLAEKTNMNFSAGVTGVELSGTIRWKKSSVEITGHYDNLSPFLSLAKTNFHFFEVPVGGGFSGKYVLASTDNDLLKIFFKYDVSSSGTDVPNPYSSDLVNFPNAGDSIIGFGLKNTNIYFNSSYRHTFDRIILRTAVSASNNKDNINWGPIYGNNLDWRVQGRVEALYNFNDQVNLLVGSEIQRYQFNQTFSTYTSGFNEILAAGYAELEWKPVHWLAFKPGLRYEHSNLLNKDNLGPRIAMAIGTGNYSQISLAYGLFYEDPDKKYLFSGYRPDFQNAVHYIANYQWMRNNRTFRIETYYKSYNQLVYENLGNTVKYDANPYRFIPLGENINNSGSGYAKGLEVFWRDNASIPDLDYWVSYSYIDTKRLYQNFRSSVTPSFVATNNLNFLVKYFIEPLQVNVGATYVYASGRPFYNPDFNVKTAPDYHDLSFNMSYLTTLGKIFGVAYMGIDNVLNQKNIYGYEFSPDGTSHNIVPALYRTVYIGFTISLSRFTKEEL